MSGRVLCVLMDHSLSGALTVTLGNTGSLSVSEQRQLRANWIFAGKDVVWLDTHSESSVSAEVGGGTVPWVGSAGCSRPAALAVGMGLGRQGEDLS